MSTATPNKQKTELTKKFSNLRSMLERGKGQLELAMAKHLDPDRMIRLALTAATRNPKLFECTQESIGLSLLTASQLGIEPNGRDGHLVPYGKQCQFIPDYKGLIKLAYRNPRVQSFHATAVRTNDEFDFQYGTESYIRHRPALSNPGELVCAYAICKLKDAEAQFVVMGKEAIEKRKAKAMTKNVWEAWPDEMWAKTAIKSLSKFVPLGGEFEKAVEHDSQIEGGETLNVAFAGISGSDDSGKSTCDKLADQLSGNGKKEPEQPAEPVTPIRPTWSTTTLSQIFVADMKAAGNLEALTAIKNRAYAESQIPDGLPMDDWVKVNALYGELKKSFE